MESNQTDVTMADAATEPTTTTTTSTTAAVGTKRERDTNNDQTASPSADRNADLPSFKLVVSNAGKNLHRENFKKLLDSVDGFKYRNSKKNLADHAGFVTFFNEEDLQTGLALLLKATNKHGASLIIDRATPKKRKTDTRIHTDEGNEPKNVADVVTAWHAVSYPEQLARKQLEVFKALKRAIRNLRKTMERKQIQSSLGPPGLVSSWIASGFQLTGSAMDTLDVLEEEREHNIRRRLYTCISESPMLHRIVSSPQINGYRNKCEFTFGTEKTTGEASLGFRIGNFNSSDGKTVIESPRFCVNVPTSIKAVCARIFSVVKGVQATLPVYDQISREGVWRTVMVRASVTTGEMMAVVTVRDAGLDDDARKLLSETTQRIVDVLTLKTPTDLSGMIEAEELDDEGGVGSEKINQSFPCTSLFVQCYNSPGFPSDDDPIEKLYGSDSMVEVLGGLRFQVLPGSFFQVNTRCAEVLFDEAREWICNGVALPSASASTPVTVSESVEPSPTTNTDSTTVVDSSKEGTATDMVVDSKANTAAKSDIGNSPPVVLLDVCCGTGTIGLLMASRVAHVVGVEMCQPAVDSARLNATANSVTNTSFVCARAEQAIAPLVLEPGKKRDGLLASLGDGKGSETSGGAGAMKATGLPVAELTQLTETLATLDAMRAEHNGQLRFAVIVDPPRAGLHHSVTNCLQCTPDVSRIVYVSCNPTGSFVDDLVSLCRPHKVGAPLPFRAICAQPFDMFPHTPHCELLCLFERLSPEAAEADITKAKAKTAERIAAGGSAHGGGKIGKNKKKKPCREYKNTGACKYGTRCKFAHGEDKDSADNVPLRVCFNFKQTGVCSFGEKCHFDHGGGISAMEACAKRKAAGESAAVVAAGTPAVATDTAVVVTVIPAVVADAAAEVVASDAAVSE